MVPRPRSGWLGSLSLLAFLTGATCTGRATAANILQADGPGGTYDLLRTAYTVEVPDCGHMVEHITEEQDAELGRPVFVFELHVDEDDDRCMATDRQRAEIRARAEDIVAAEGETVHYAWKFKLDADFQGSPNFTHIFQIKSNEDPPIMTLTPRVDTMAIDGRIGVHGETDLGKFLGVWVQVELRVLYAEAGELAMTIRRVDNDAMLFDYSGDADTWDANASGHDSKFGLYRSLSSANQLRDEQVRFADFCASKISAAECVDIQAPGSGMGGAGGAGGTPNGGSAAGSDTPSGGSGGSTSGGSAGTGPIGGTSQAGTAPTTPGNAGSSTFGGTAVELPSGDAAPDESGGCACRLPPSPSDQSTQLLLLAACASALALRRSRPR